MAFGTCVQVGAGIVPGWRETARERHGTVALSSTDMLIGAVARAAALAVTLFALIVGATMVSHAGAAFEFDFKGDLYRAGQAITHGASPYDLKTLEHEAATLRAGTTFPPTASPRWPAPILIAAIPMSLLPPEVAACLFMLVSAVAVILTFRLLGVRDWPAGRSPSFPGLQCGGFGSGTSARCCYWESRSRGAS
jgi:hypothetical protein